MINLRQARLACRPCRRAVGIVVGLICGLMPTAGWNAERPQLQRVRLVPQQVSLRGRDTTQRFVAMGKFSDGRERDVSHLSQFSIADPQLAVVEASGRVRSRGEGQTRLRVEVAGHQAEAEINIGVADRTSGVGFAREVARLLTRRGCNGSECHGGVKGRGGFKLSLYGMHPQEDHRWIVAGGVYQVLTDKIGQPQIPRIDLQRPAQSLLLLKPTMAVDHDGGERFTADSPDYQLLLRWIRAGAPFGSASDIQPPQCQHVYPQQAVLDSDGRQQILVTAQRNEGQTEDLTDQVHYESSDSTVIRVDDQGVVQAVAAGEAFVTVRAPGFTGIVRCGVTGSRSENFPEVPGRNYIDEHIFAKLEQLNIAPSELSRDAVFLRRVCLSLTGTLPPPARVREFLSNPDPQKRDQLIDTLLGTPEYVDYWTYRLGQLFRIRGSAHPEHGYAYWHWLRDGVVRNRPYDQLARERIAGQGFQGPSRHYPTDDFHPGELMGEQVRVFLGRRLECAQCHDHPFEHWTQEQFWGLAAFYGRISRTDWPGFAATIIFDDPQGPDPDYGSRVETVKVTNPRTGVEAAPTFLDGRVLPAEQRTDLRMRLAEWMTAHPYFAEATANRIWSYLFGRGLVAPLDDFRSDNPPTHPQLLRALADDFRTHDYDLKHLIKRIVRSRTYQLSAAANASNAQDDLNYSHFLPIPLDAELLLDAIVQVTGVPAEFENSHGGLAPRGTRAMQLVVPDIYPSRFLDVFGRRSRDRLPEGPTEANLSQALHMLVGSTYTARLSQPGGRLDRLLQNESTNAEIIEELYLAAFNRFPTSQEQRDVTQLIVRYDSAELGWQDFIWALVSAREFASNH